jgi:hypothetical protein
VRVPDIRGARARAAVVLLAIAAASCSRPAPLFSTTNARAHVTRLAGAIGTRPAGSEANRRAREYLVEQLRFFGYAVRVQEADASRPEYGLTFRVQNIIAVLPGATPDAIGLVAHYDSVPTGPGAGDDAFGVAVCLETARLLAARADRRHTVMVLLTDAEEDGLMGAAALVKDPEVGTRLRTYINVEATGADAPAVVFETGPGNGWLVRAFADAAPRPRGGSHGFEIYRRLPNDTDFSVLERTGVPGLNVAALGDSYAYHTPRDVPERLTDALLAQAGENVLATALALDRRDLSARTDEQAVYFDVASRHLVVLSPSASRVLGVLAIVLGLAGWVRVVAAARRAVGWGSLLRTAAWAVVGALVVSAALVGASALLRAVREVYHPWYAHPGRYWLMLGLAAVASARVVTSVARRLPRGMRGTRLPAAAWAVVLPPWIGLAALVEWGAPAAAFLWTVPLAAAGFVALVLAPATGLVAQMAAALVLAVTATLWGPTLDELLRFAVPLLGRMPFVTPGWALPAALLGGLVMLAPPLAVLIAARSGDVAEDSPPRRRLSRKTPALGMALASSFAWCYVADGYTFERPLWRHVQYVADYASGRAAWEVGGNEPGLDLHLGLGAPAGWAAASGPLLEGTPARRFEQPFAFRTSVPAAGSPPISALGTLVVEGTEARLEVRVRLEAPGGMVVFALPPGLIPLRSSLPGRDRNGWWTAAYGAAPPGFVVFTAALPAAAAARLPAMRAGLVTPALPGGHGWPDHPAWLATERTVWQARAVHLVAVRFVAPGEPLR